MSCKKFGHSKGQCKFNPHKSQNGQHQNLVKLNVCKVAQRDQQQCWTPKKNISIGDGNCGEKNLGGTSDSSGFPQLEKKIILISSGAITKNDQNANQKVNTSETNKELNQNELVMQATNEVNVLLETKLQNGTKKINLESKRKLRITREEDNNHGGLGESEELEEDCVPNLLTLARISSPCIFRIDY